MKINTNNNYMINMEELKNGVWKNDNKKYLKELQAFLDKADNIKNEELKKDIINQMLKCDKELTILSEKLFKECYEKGLKEGKNSE